MQLCGYHLGAAAALETRENAAAAAAGVADRHDAVFNRDAAFAQRRNGETNSRRRDNKAD
jgi:hypothetical protein